MAASDHFPFGSQYLRGLTPPRADWARDLANMRAAGFNTIRAWLVWGVLEPRPGEIDFDYLDTFLDLAAANELRVGLLMHLHGCPEWAIRQHRDLWYVDIKGRPFESAQRANTPSGGWPGLCPDHALTQELEARFIEGVVSHCGDHPAVAFFEPINEPHVWVDMTENPIGCFCYCEASREAFRQWLRGKYGTLAGVGEAWGRRFSDWAEVRPPTWLFGFSDWVDFRTFAAESIAALVQRRSDLIRKHTRKPVIAHAWGGGCVTCGQLGAMAFDDWKNADSVDMWGYSAFPSSVPQTLMVGLGTDATRCAAGGKEFWQSELGAGDYGQGFGRNGRIRPEVEAMFCWESLRHGAQGLLFWQYRKEAHGSEIGAFGLTDYAGEETELLRAVAQVGKTLNDHAALFRSARVEPAEVALLFSYRTFMADWTQHRNCQLSVDALSGAYRIFWDANIPVDVLHEERLAAAALARYKLIVLPNPAALCEAAREPLREYVRQGGTLLSDPYLCGFNHDLSLPREVPGGGFAEVFGVRERDLVQGRGRRIMLTQGEREIAVEGSLFQAFWQPSGAEVVARYDDGQAAVLRHGYGRGQAIMSGVNLGLACSTKQGVGDDFTREGREIAGGGVAGLVLDLAAQAGVQARVRTPDDIRASVLSTPDGQHLLIALNLADAPRAGRIEVEGLAGSEARDLLQGGDTTLDLQFAPYESKVLLLV
ncbi:beta-galactosidase [bacterium]|nr:beta-galactosidase [bacterium]